MKRERIVEVRQMPRSRPSADSPARRARRAGLFEVGISRAWRSAAIRPSPSTPSRIRPVISRTRAASSSSWISTRPTPSGAGDRTVAKGDRGAPGIFVRDRLTVSDRVLQSSAGVVGLGTGNLGEDARDQPEGRLIRGKAVLEGDEKRRVSLGLSCVQGAGELAEAVPALAREAVELPHGQDVGLVVSDQPDGFRRLGPGLAAGNALVDQEAGHGPALGARRGRVGRLLPVDGGRVVDHSRESKIENGPLCVRRLYVSFHVEQNSLL
uniref:Integrase n=1 Tax=Arthrobacter phage phi AAU2 TaxID=50892 RepID=Q37982_9CAUD|nr:integrase [Arthrobacter phage phi AAU2]